MANNFKGEEGVCESTSLVVSCLVLWNVRAGCQ